jgi:parallel beta-helix repeat protein
MRRRLVVLGALLAGLCVTGAASAATIVVKPGDSIQAAIDRASPGDTILVRPGTYAEYLTIQKDNLTLKASGVRGSVLLVPEKDKWGSCPFNDSSGICVHGQVDQYGNLGPPVSGTRIVGFTVANFFRSGIAFLNANDSAVTATELRGNRDYGIIGWALSTVRFANNVAHDNRLGGFFILESANATVSGNQSYRNFDRVCIPQFCEGNGAGFLFEDSSHGVVRNNNAWDNCVGYAFYDSGDAPLLRDWTVTGNTARHNNAVCPNWGPPSGWLYGVGFLLSGTQNVVLSANIAQRNAGPAGKAGGIVLVSSSGSLGPDPTDNVVKDNVALKNRPFDIRWDETGSGNLFRNNTCHTSEPSWICAGLLGLSLVGRR